LRTNWAVEQRSDDSVVEHEHVRAALNAGDAEAGAEAMRAHIHAGYVSEQPEKTERTPPG
jgi:DNA-binding GntR family transcriptional regulator